MKQIADKNLIRKTNLQIFAIFSALKAPFSSDFSAKYCAVPGHRAAATSWPPQARGSGALWC